MTISITSTAFADGDRIPARYTGEGEDISPPLAWSGLPAGTKELVIICEDPDAPTAEPWVHWVIYKIPACLQGLPEGIPQKARLKSPTGVFQGLNSWSTPSKPSVGYRGPLPPPSHGIHHYHFTICALDTKLIIDPSVSAKMLIAEFRDHVLEMGCLTGLYSR
jgi:Raf kinase inhibitor-like YbhB/YbcL family protein